MAPPLRFFAPWFRHCIAIVSLALLVVIVGHAPNHTPTQPTPPETANVSEAALAAFKGQPGIVMYAGGCAVVCGESTVSTSFSPAGSIDLASATFSALNPPTVSYDVTQIGVAKFGTLDVEKYLDVATPALLKRLTTGPAIPSVVVNFYTPAVGTTPARPVFLKYTLTNALVTSYKVVDNAAHTESFSLQFEQAKVEYFPSQTGSPSPPPTPLPFCWNAPQNRAC
jgi:type VI protein secretion system component Hcp